MASGRWILDHQQIPQSDPFSYTALGNPWVHHEWGASLFFWFLTLLFGFKSINILKIILFAGVLYFSARRIQFHFQNSSIPFFSVFFLAFVCQERILDRPHMFSLFFISLLFWILQRNNFSFRIVAGLFVMFVFWANLHAEVLLGLGLVLFYWIVQIKNPYRSLIFFLSAFVVLINPYFLKIYQFPFEHLAMKEIVAHTLEWTSPFAETWRWMFTFQGYYLLLVLTGFVFLTRWKKLPTYHLIVGVVLGYLSARYNRYTAEFAIWAVPFLMVQSWGAMGGRAGGGPRPKGPPSGPARSERSTAGGGSEDRTHCPPNWIKGGICGFVLFLLLWRGVPYQWGEPWQRHGWGIDQRIAPVAEVNFIKDYSLSSRIFAKDSLGSYLIFENFPVFIDGRTPLYGNDFFREYQSALDDPNVFEQLRKKWDFGILLLPRFWASSMKGLHEYLLNSPDWVLVYYGETAYLYLDRRPAHAEVIAQVGTISFPLEDFSTSH